MILRILSCLLVAFTLLFTPAYSIKASPERPETRSIGGDVARAEAKKNPESDAQAAVAAPLFGVTADGHLQLPEISATSPLTSTSNLELLGHIGGNAYGLAIQGGYAYLGEGPTLAVLDITGPYTPTLAGRSERLPYMIRDLDAQGDTLYAADTDTGLHIFDISNPPTPQEIGSIQMPDSIFGVVISDTMAYVADGDDGGLQIIDVSDPEHPVAAGSYRSDYGAWSAHDVEIRGSLVYLVGSQLMIIDVSDPAQPLLVGSCNLPRNSYGFDLQGQYAYVVDHTYGLRVIDVSDPANPFEVGYSLPEDHVYYRYGVVEGETAYVSSEGRGPGIRAFDISDPAHPQQVSYTNRPRNISQIDIQADTLYVLDSDTGLWKLEASSPAHPALNSLYRIIGNIRDIFIRQGVAYLAAGPNGLYALDASDPANMVTLSRSEHIQENGYGVQEIAVAGNLAYLADGYGMTILDISNPSQPVEVSFLPLSGAATAIAVSDGKAYIGIQYPLPDDIVFLDIVDVSDPAHPSLIVHYSTRGPIWGIAVDGQTVFLAASYAGLKIYNVSDPAHPVHLYDYLFHSRVYGIQLAGDLAYLPGEGLRSVDVSDPSHPALVSSFNGIESWETYDVALSGHIACIVAFSLSAPPAIIVLDITRPGRMHELGSAETIGNMWTTTIDGERIYAGGGEGLYVYRLSEHTLHLPVVHR